MPWWSSKVLSYMQGNRGNTWWICPRLIQTLPMRCWTKKEGMRFNSPRQDSCWNSSIYLFADGKPIPVAFLSPKNWRHKPLLSSMLKTSPKLWQPARWGWTHQVQHHPSQGFWRTRYDLPTPQFTPKLMGCWTLTWWPKVRDVLEGLVAPRCFNSSSSPWGISYQAPMQGEIPEWPKLTSGERGLAAV